MMRPFFLALAALAASPSTWGWAQEAPAAPLKAAPEIAPKIEPASLQKRMVWVHSMMNFPLELKHIIPYFSREIGAEAFGVNYPLLQELGLEERLKMGWQGADALSARASGVDGFAVDVFAGDAGHYLGPADKIGFPIAPCLDLSNVPADKIEDVAFEAIVKNCKMGTHPSAARIKLDDNSEAFLFFTYGTGMVSPQGWGRVRARVAREGYKTFIMAAVESRGDLALSKEFPRQEIEPYLPHFEAGYSFSHTGRYWDDLLALYKEKQKPFGGGMMPGYYRVGGGYYDARATEAYREDWRRHIQSRVPWVCISTWNDLAENTNIMPTADWNFSRSEITRWFSAKFKGEKIPWQQPHLYITTPKAIYRGSKYLVEGLALNASSKYLRVSVELVDANKKPIGKETSVRVAPHQEGAAVLELNLSQFPPGRFVRAKSILRAGSQVLASVVSAPILVLDEAEQPGFPTTYYSIPAHKSLPGTVRIKMDGKPSGGRQVAASVVPPPSTWVRFAEVLQNTEMGRNFFGARPFETQVPRLNENGSIRGGSEWGFYLSRVTDSNFRVGYSDPIYVAPRGDVNLWERFSFDEGEGKVARDASIYRKVGELQNVEWARPGFDGSAACLRFNGRDAVLNLRPYKTPTGPLSITFAVRPAALSGFLYADGAGMWTEINGEGTLSFTRNSPAGFITARGKTRLKVGEWARLKFTYDGKMSRIYINEVLDGEIACPPGHPIGGHVLGYNPYGGSYFQGEIDELEVRALPTLAKL